MAFDWRKTLGAIAPIAGTMIGGPFGAIAGAAIGKVFGHEGEAPPTDVQMEEYIKKATPDQLEKLKALDNDLQIKMRELGITEKQLSFDDTKDARTNHSKSHFPMWLCIMLTIGFFGSLYLMMTTIIPDANKSVVYLMIGSLGTAWVGSTQYWNGTTKGSSDKNNMLSTAK